MIAELYGLMTLVMALGIALFTAGMITALLFGRYGGDVGMAVAMVGVLIALFGTVATVNEVNTFDFTTTYEYSKGDPLAWGGEYIGQIDGGLIFLAEDDTQMIPVDTKIVKNVGYKDFEIIEIKENSIIIKYQRRGLGGHIE